VDDKSIRFFILGNWGGSDSPPYITPGQKLCADLTLNLGQVKKPQFFVSTGNNFYSNGVQNVDDPRFQTTFNDVFLYGKEAPVPWYVVAGNRDWFGNVSAQIEYGEMNRRWVFPSYAYSATFDSRPQGPQVDIIWIDTFILCGNALDDETDIKNPEEPIGPDWAEGLWAWTEEQLANSTADYLFVVGHYPALSANSPISQCLVPRLQNLLEKYNATAYISGHENNLQHIQTVSATNGTIHHVISGAGQSVKPNQTSFNFAENQWKASSQFLYPKAGDGAGKSRKITDIGGMVYAELGAKSGTFEYYTCDGDYLHNFQVQART